jgi:hypothetical protein
VQGVIQWRMPCAQYRQNIHHGAGEDGMKNFKQRGTGDLLPYVCYTRREEIGSSTGGGGGGGGGGEQGG